MKKLLSWILVAVMLMMPLTSLAEGEEAPVGAQRVRTIVTADWLDDDQCSLIRFLLYSNEYEVAGIIADKTEPGEYPIAGGVYEFDGKSVMNKDIAQVFIDAYAKDYENLKLHDENYPTPEYLTSINVDGNIAYCDYMSDTDGSKLIRDCIMDDREDTLFIQCWGGTATLAAALRSIEDEYKDTEEWDAVYQKVCNKVMVWHDLGQDSCYDDYIIPNWPNLYTIMSYSQFGAMVILGAPNIPGDQLKYYAGDWVAQNITNGNSALSKAYYDIQGMHKSGAATAAGTEDGQNAIAEGDTPNFFYIFDNGLRQLENPAYGGWGGRFVNSNQAVFMINRGSQGKNFWVDVADDGDIYKPIYRWTEAFQNDFAARMGWTYKSYEEANHAPVVQVVEGIDLTAERGDAITLTAQTSDPDGDAVSVKFWQYEDADSYGDTVELVPGEGDQVTLTIPENAKNGDTIHVIVEAQDDDEATPITRYQRVIITVIDPNAPAAMF